MGNRHVPQSIFFVKGIGRHKDELASFEDALRNAGIEKFNLVVTVSSIFPPKCRIISARKGLSLLEPGEIVHCVIARLASKETNRLLAAAVGLAKPKDSKQYGYLSEHHAFGQTGKIAGDYAEDLAASMLGTMLGIEVDPEKDWSERRKEYRSRGHILKSRHICQSAEVTSDGRWTTVIAVAMMVS
ncbi:MAG: arginine decarboxylase, pyruvoyl-dependent [Candidatus Komeilibacteria bacterium CG_4_10_14_0_2_um_filter_37_10]|uniref:Pyruvoyl-dependent arginine decarboxylase AaxB n=1 Tax=Candidatus Komeilibacteria bacterium CG_4_10_14_0_2_um_filter_37_10 TaxID=1974470 RepID=A0A2M7VE70_9BACT|nr:MAG: arginine decarboxylase, pyruvoyl-dependent [Candidatus Komeilibacteria bacterium CG_4_10_14_0_2_um_filter_37_10]PJA94267.1 MAG: arginine decarboxylase, pyruvoyl-dependent [Candidatus Komeilibacteria bacterium CG_4_9_14_3_um_filter_37_5]